MVLMSMRTMLLVVALTALHVAALSQSLLHKEPEQSFVSPVKQDSENRGRKCGLVWFYHIPKCGGTAVQNWMRTMAKEHNFDGYLDLFSNYDFINFDDFKASWLEDIIANPQGRLVGVHHHHRGPALYGFNDTFNDIQTRLRATGCDLYRMSFLRTPDTRLKSALFYNSDPAGCKRCGAAEMLLASGNEDTRNKHFLDIMTESTFDNGIVRYVLNNKASKKRPEVYPIEFTHVTDEAVSKAYDILGSFDVVGFSDHLQEGLDLISQVTGAQSMPIPVSNVHDHVSDLPSFLEDIIKERVVKDWSLYDAIRNVRTDAGARIVA